MGKITGTYFVLFLPAFRIVVSPAAIPVKHGIAVTMSAFSLQAGIESGFRKHAL